MTTPAGEPGSGGSRPAGGAGGGPQGLPAEEPLVGVIAHLRGELDGLREAMASRAVIEQAKGVLRAWYGGNDSAAFARLVQTSQDANRKLAEVAADIVALATTRPATPPAEAAEVVSLVSRLGDSPTRQPAGRRRSSVATEDRREYVELLDVLLEHVAAGPGEPPTTAALLTVEPDGTLRLVASRGHSAASVRTWRRLPGDLRLPSTDAARGGSSVWIRDPGQRDRDYPAHAGAMTSGAVAAVPLLHQGAVRGVLRLGWAAAQPLDQTERDHLEAVREPAGQALAALERSGAVVGIDVPEWLLGLLDVVATPVALLTPVRVRGRPADFRFVWTNEALNDTRAGLGGALVGETLLETWPGAVPTRLFDSYCDVLASGEPLRAQEAPWVAVLEGRERRGTIRISAARVGGGLMLSWTDVHTADGQPLYADGV